MTPTTDREIALNVTGMTCDACATHVRDALRGVAGVRHVELPDWRGGRATVIAGRGVAWGALLHAVQQAGYGARLEDAHEPRASGAEEGYDLIVIGTGGAGMGAALRAAGAGARVALVEGGTLGGTCVNVGCVPSKTLLRAAEAHHKAAHPRFGGLPAAPERVDWPRLVAGKDELVQRLRTGKYEDVIAAYGDRITLVRGRARLTSPGTVQVDGRRTLQAERIVVATGAHPRILPLEGIEDVDVLTSTTAMELPERPDSLVVLGGRFVALEQAQLFARLGTRVTVLQRSERLIPDHEPELSAGIEQALAEEGVEVHTGATPVSIRSQHGVRLVGARMRDGRAQEFSAQHVLMAVGRRANTEGLGLAELGVALDGAGAVMVDEHLRTSVPGIYAAGDVTQHPQLVYVAAAAGGTAAANALHGDTEALHLDVLPEVIFTDPQVATVGLTEAQARAQGHAVSTTVLPLEHVPRALAARDTRGLIKLVADETSGRLLGAHVLAAEGGEIIQTAALAIQAGRRYGFTVQDLRGMLFPYLVQAEGLKLAALSFEKDVRQLSCCAG